MRNFSGYSEFRLINVSKKELLFSLNVKKLCSLIYFSVTNDTTLQKGYPYYFALPSLVDEKQNGYFSIKVLVVSNDEGQNLTKTENYVLTVFFCAFVAI